MASTSPKNQPPRLITFKQLIKTHHGRAYFLGGSCLAMLTLSTVGLATLVNPRVPIPVVDGLLGQLPAQTAARVLQETESSASQTVSGAGAPSATTTPPPAETNTNAQTNAPRGEPSTLPLWIYGVIVLGSLVGPSLFTYGLYRLYQQSRRRPQIPRQPAQEVGRSPLPMSPPQDS
ncbi:hypothetical protein AWQ21_03455 [Picosynechococcus sp. PCC 7003]|uniref:hypothetical protein n=1 Tax=Picosynechococcus sp. PCC 7003 TaxID=374981 RepID=UPI0008108BBA|nr:hypothetical protein [Picosynechococcus sp. PCC 7003]ANV83518.1 hypothetical protein AWQ21_03455 [Picosynechococcus sp. PCC 7003]